MTLIAQSLASVSSASVASASAAALSSLSSQSAASVSLASVSSASVRSRGGNPAVTDANGGLQADSNDGQLPHWSIAVMSTLGALLLLALLAGAYLLIRARRRRQDSAAGYSKAEASPDMTANPDANGHSLLTGAGLSAAAAAIAGGSRSRTSSRQQRHDPDTKALLSRNPPTNGSVHTGAEESAISAAEAAAMGEAFRAVLRKPSFVHASSDESGASGSTLPAAIPPLPTPLSTHSDASNPLQHPSGSLPSATEQLEREGKSVKSVNSTHPVTQ